MQRVLSNEVLSYAGQEVKLSGWVHTLRNFREVKFIVLRDRGGVVQCVVDPGSEIDVSGLGKEFCVNLTGTVKAEDRAPGGAEVHVTKLEVLSTAQEPPLEINHPPKMKK
ncbi:MAG: OB-fold nucleic acid binding domain-containing protein, partial [Planctomycetota bacterium]